MADASSTINRVRAFAISPDGELMAAAGFALDPARDEWSSVSGSGDLKHDSARADDRRADHRSVLHGVRAGRPRSPRAASRVKSRSGTSRPATASRRSSSGLPRSALSPSARWQAHRGLRTGQGYQALRPGAEPRDIHRRPAKHRRSRLCSRAMDAYGAQHGRRRVRALGSRHRPEALTAQGAAIAFAPDCRSLALSGSRWRSVELIDTEMGSDRCTIELGWGPTSGVLAFSPDGHTIITERGGTLRFFETASGREQFGTPEAHAGKCERCPVSYRTAARLSRPEMTGQSDSGMPPRPRPLGVIRHGGVVAVLSRFRQTARASRRPHLGLTRRWRSGIWPPAPGGKSGASLTAVTAHWRSHFHPTAIRSWRSTGTDGLRILEIATGEDREVEQPRFSLDQTGTRLGDDHRGVLSGNQFLAVTTATTASWLTWRPAQSGSRHQAQL